MCARHPEKHILLLGIIDRILSRGMPIWYCNFLALKLCCVKILHHTIHVNDITLDVCRLKHAIHHRSDDLLLCPIGNAAF